MTIKNEVHCNRIVHIPLLLLLLFFFFRIEEDMAFSAVRSFILELVGPSDAVYTSGEVVSGKVVLVLHRASKVRSMKVLGRGVAMAHWLENRTVGMNAVYNDYTSKITYFRKRQHLIRGQ